MHPYFFLNPISLPRPEKTADDAHRQGVDLLCRRLMELLHAAALIDSTEPGLLTREDRETARRRGAACAKRVLADDYPKGKAHVAYYRALTERGFEPTDAAIKLYDRLWILEDRCGLADSYLRAAADTALQKGAEVILCPSPLRRDRIEAVFLPGVRAAFLSERAADGVETAKARRVHLDRIPGPECRKALRGDLRENRRLVESLVNRAARYLTNARLLRDLETITCADTAERL